jgi:uncharacterized membrane protein YhiD involved in acid resistance
MELKDYIAMGTSLIAIILSIVSFISSRKMGRVVLRQSMVEKKYEVLFAISEQKTRMSQLRSRISKINNLQIKQESNGLDRVLRELMESGDSRYELVRNVDVSSTSHDKEIQIRETIGLLKERESILNSADLTIKELESFDSTS